MIPAQGDICWAEASDKRRPVLVVTRSEAVPVLTWVVVAGLPPWVAGGPPGEAVPVLTWVVVAPVTRTVRDIPTEVPLDTDEGLPEPCAAAFDNLQPIADRS